MGPILNVYDDDDDDDDKLGITDGVSVSLVSPWPLRWAAKQSD
jgi:hypothetical protein